MVGNRKLADNVPYRANKGATIAQACSQDNAFKPAAAARFTPATCQLTLQVELLDAGIAFLVTYLKNVLSAAFGTMDRNFRTRCSRHAAQVLNRSSRIV